MPRITSRKPNPLQGSPVNIIVLLSCELRDFCKRQSVQELYVGSTNNLYTSFAYYQESKCSLADLYVVYQTACREDAKTVEDLLVKTGTDHNWWGKENDQTQDLSANIGYGEQFVYIAYR